MSKGGELCEVDAIVSLINSKHVLLMRVIGSMFVAGMMMGSMVLYQINTWKLHRANDWSFPEMKQLQTETKLLNKDANSKVVFADPTPIHEAYQRTLGIVQ